MCQYPAIRLLGLPTAFIGPGRNRARSRMRERLRAPAVPENEKALPMVSNGLLHPSFVRSPHPKGIIPKRYKSAGNSKDPLYHERIKTMTEASSMMITEMFYASSQLQAEIAENRCTHFDHGFTEVGKYRALCSAEEQQQRIDAVSEIHPYFYVHQNTRATL